MQVDLFRYLLKFIMKIVLHQNHSNPSTMKYEKWNCLSEHRVTNGMGGLMVNVLDFDAERPGSIRSADITNHNQSDRDDDTHLRSSLCSTEWLRNTTIR